MVNNKLNISIFILSLLDFDTYQIYNIILKITWSYKLRNFFFENMKVNIVFDAI